MNLCQLSGWICLCSIVWSVCKMMYGRKFTNRSSLSSFTFFGGRFFFLSLTIFANRNMRMGFDLQWWCWVVCCQSSVAEQSVLHRPVRWDAWYYHVYVDAVGKSHTTRKRYSTYKAEYFNNPNGKYPCWSCEKSIVRICVHSLASLGFVWFSLFQTNTHCDLLIC